LLICTTHLLGGYELKRMMQRFVSFIPQLTTMNLWMYYSH